MILFLFACSQSKDDTDSGESSLQEDIVLSTTSPPEGNISCFPTGKDDNNDWNVVAPNPDKITPHSLDIITVDFSGTPIPNAKIRLFMDNDPFGTPTQEHHSNAQGMLNLSLPSCTPYAYTVEYEDSLLSIEAGQVDRYTQTEEGENEFNAFSQQDLVDLLSMLEESNEPNNGLAIGLVSDCNDEPLSNIEVKLRSSEGILQNPIKVYYFDEDGIRNDGGSSPMGMWTILDIPPGIWSVEMYGLIDNQPRLLGSAPIYIKPMGIYFTNIVTGSDLGYYFHPTCL